MKILMDGKQSREFLASFPRFFLIVIKLTLLPTLSRFIFFLSPRLEFRRNARNLHISNLMKRRGRGAIQERKMGWTPITMSSFRCPFNNFGPSRHKNFIVLLHFHQLDD